MGPGSSPSSPSPTPAPLCTGIPAEELRRATSAPPQFHPYTVDPRLLCTATASRGGNDHAVPLSPFLLRLRVRGFLAVVWQRRRAIAEALFRSPLSQSEPTDIFPLAVLVLPVQIPALTGAGTACSWHTGNP